MNTTEYRPIIGDSLLVSISMVNNGTGPPGDHSISLLTPCDPFSSNLSAIPNKNESDITYDTHMIKSIHFSQGRIEFALGSSRKQNESITIYNNANEILKTVKFERDLFPGSSSSYRLNAMTFSKNATDQVKERYEFSYNTAYPYAENNCSIDLWGYCNGYTSEPGSISYPDRSFLTWPHAEGFVSLAPYTYNIPAKGIWESKDNEMKRNILEKIKYPTGGITTFGMKQTAI